MFGIADLNDPTTIIRAGVGAWNVISLIELLQGGNVHKAILALMESKK